MSNETDKPMAGALRAAHELNAAMVRAFYVNPQMAASIIARESGLSELVEAVEMARVTDPGKGSRALLIRRDDWNRIVAAARHVREG